MRRHLRALVAALLGLGLGLGLATSAAWAAPLAVLDDRGRRVELPAPPARIVSLVPSLTEAVCGLGACSRLVGVDRFSNHPVAVRKLPQLGGLEDTQVERLVALRPDVVFTAVSSRANARLEGLGLRVVALEPRDLPDTERVLQRVATVLGDEAAAARLWSALEQRIGAAAARVPAGWRGQRAYIEVASTPYAAGEASFVGQIAARLGLANIVPAAQGPFPQLNPEFVVRAQPALVVATARAVAEMPARPGWAALAALRERRSCGLSPERWEPLVRPGPRLAEAAEALADCLAALPPPGAMR